MYIRLNQIKLEIDENEQTLRSKAAKKLLIEENKIEELVILKKSIDGRMKNSIKYSYVLQVKLKAGTKINKKVYNNNIMSTEPTSYKLPARGNEKMAFRPVVVGSGPAGMFCGYFLAKHGYKPIVIERGQAVEDRVKAVEEFWSKGKLCSESNVQFGEGGAGTFSDGKLNTTIRDDTGRNKLVLETFVRFGAPDHIMYTNKPHIGTDILMQVVRNMRNEIINLGGQVFFSHKLEDIIIEKNSLKGIVARDINKASLYEIATDNLVLALGHSARDTFYMLKEKGFQMEAKPFAVGVRVEHKQDMINQVKYGDLYKDKLPAADYKVTYTTKKGRGVYSFCMCPGGFVVNASSEEGRLAVNGMSYSKRDGENANSAIIVSVKPEDFPGEDILRGMEFQRDIEEKAYNECGGHIPVQRLEDFNNNTVTEALGNIKPNVKGRYEFGNINNILPAYITESIKEAMPEFAKDIQGFDNKDTLLLAVESRTSSPVRIIRNDTFQANIDGIYPCGEGAGYAGGITSAAADGIRVFEAIYKKYGI